LKQAQNRVNDFMRILFVALQSKNATSNAYNQRIFNNERHCRQLGAETSILFMGDLLFHSPVLLQPLNIPFILRYIRKFDVVIAEAAGPAYLLALAKHLLRTDTLLVYDEHNDALAECRLVRKGRFDLAGYFIEFEMRLLEYVGFNGIDYFSAASPGLKRRLLERNRRIRDEHVEVILNGVNLESFGSKPETVNNSCENSFTVTYAGSYVRYQGIETLVKAAEILRNQDVHFKFLGFRKEDLAIKEEILNRLGVKATLLDWLPKDELLSELWKSDILIIPSMAGCNRAIFPAKFAEFLALAKPVIVTRIDETASIVERFDCGFVCKPTAESISDTILEAKGTSKKVLHLKGYNGRKFAETELDINLICKKYLKFLGKLLKQRKSFLQ
jgi:glycosyltransferase involved in cell wall biosynthesis